MVEHFDFKNYFASEDGYVISFCGLKPRKLKALNQGTGYLKVCLQKDKKVIQKTVHRFIWECFYGKIQGGLEINHKDKNKTNNSLLNLELVTPTLNKLHLQKNPGAHYYKGQTSKRKWLSVMRVNGKRRFLGSFLTAEEASNRFKEEYYKIFKEPYPW